MGLGCLPERPALARPMAYRPAYHRPGPLGTLDFIGRSIGQGRIAGQPKAHVIFSKWDAISWRGSLVARGSGSRVRIKVTSLSLFDGPQ